jgi:uncharacterized protein (TIGR03435 family)
MVQTLLADRFKLAIHRVATSQGIYALVVAKGGLKLKQAVTDAGAPVPVAALDPDAPPAIGGFFGETQEQAFPNADGKSDTTTISNPRMGTVRVTEGPNLIQRMEAPAIAFAGLADLLDRMIPSETPVIDMTGLKGRYQVVLEVSLKDLPKAQPATPGTGDPAAMDRDDAVLQRFNDGLRKLGLHLERRKGPLETLVVDHVEKTPTGN